MVLIIFSARVVVFCEEEPCKPSGVVDWRVERLTSLVGDGCS